MSSFAFSPIRGPPKKSDETSEETKAPVRKGSPIPTATEQYAIYAGDPQHPYNLQGNTIDKIFNNCDMMKKEQRKTFYNELLGIKVKIGLGNNDYEQLREDYGDRKEQLSQFDGFLKTQLDLLCKGGETYFNTFYTELNLLLYGKKFAEAFATIPYPYNTGGSKTRKKCRRFRNNFRKNKISRKYIMLKQCGGGKAKMGAKSKPYSSKKKAMKSRRRVCYYKKKGRTLKLKKKKKSRGRKKSRRRR